MFIAAVLVNAPNWKPPTNALGRAATYVHGDTHTPRSPTRQHEGMNDWRAHLLAWGSRELHGVKTPVPGVPRCVVHLHRILTET